MKDIEEEIGISHGTVHQILTEDLNYSKKSARWVPRLLTADQKKARLEASEEFVKLVRRQPEGNRKASLAKLLQWMSQWYPSTLLKLRTSPSNGFQGGLRGL